MAAGPYGFDEEVARGPFHSPAGSGCRWMTPAVGVCDGRVIGS